MSREAALQRASRFDDQVLDWISENPLDPADLLRDLRHELAECGQNRYNNLHALLQKQQNPGVYRIVLGPTMDHDDDAGHFLFDSGARLAFGLTLKKVKQRWRLTGYFFALHFPGKHKQHFLRFCLTCEKCDDALEEPLCHVHASCEDLRLPSPMLDPRHVLAWIVYAGGTVA